MAKSIQKKLFEPEQQMYANHCFFNILGTFKPLKLFSDLCGSYLFSQFHLFFLVD